MNFKSANKKEMTIFYFIMSIFLFMYVDLGMGGTINVAHVGCSKHSHMPMPKIRGVGGNV